MNPPPSHHRKPGAEATGHAEPRTLNQLAQPVRRLPPAASIREPAAKPPQEAERKRPDTQNSGRWINSLSRSAGFRRRLPYVNPPPNQNRKPGAEATGHAEPRTLNQLAQPVRRLPPAASIREPAAKPPQEAGSGSDRTRRTQNAESTRSAGPPASAGGFHT